ncbi:Uncharacterised protein [Bordetella pertussis]|nr:Uncharacterised protein [Bordetella pertussis]
MAGMPLSCTMRTDDRSLWPLRARPAKARTILARPCMGRMNASFLPPPSLCSTASSASNWRRMSTSPCCAASMKARASRMPSLSSTAKRGRDSRTRLRARAANWRQPASVRPSVPAISANGTSNTSCSRKAARSDADSRSSASISATDTSCAISPGAAPA